MSARGQGMTLSSRRSTRGANQAGPSRATFEATEIIHPGAFPTWHNSEIIETYRGPSKYFTIKSVQGLFWENPFPTVLTPTNPSEIHAKYLDEYFRDPTSHTPHQTQSETASKTW